MKRTNIFTDGDSWLNRGLSRLFDILLLGLITMVLCVPVITAGAAITANMDIMLQCALKKDSKIFKRYFRVFAKNFPKATLIWLIFLIVGILIIGAVVVTLGGFLTMDSTVRVIAAILSLIMLVLYGFAFAYVFALQSRYENPIGTTILNAILISLSNMPRSILMFGMTVVLAVLGYFFIGLLPLFILIELSFVTYFSAKLMVPVLAKLGDREAAGEDPEEIVSEEEQNAQSEK